MLVSNPTALINLDNTLCRTHPPLYAKVNAHSHPNYLCRLRISVDAVVLPPPGGATTITIRFLAPLDPRPTRFPAQGMARGLWAINTIDPRFFAYYPLT